MTKLLTYSDFKIGETIIWQNKTYIVLNKYNDLEYGILEYELQGV